MNHMKKLAQLINIGVMDDVILFFLFFVFFFLSGIKKTKTNVLVLFLIPGLSNIWPRDHDRPTKGSSTAHWVTLKKKKI